MDIKLKDKNGATLHTAKKYIEEDIKVVLDDSLLPSGTIDITENGEVDVASYEKANVSVNTLNKFLSGTKLNITKEDLAGMTSMRERLFANQPITSVEFPETLTNISRYVFNSCLSLAEVIIPGNIKQIEQGAFASSGVKNVKLLEGVIYIGVDGFQYCANIENLELPSTITTIERYAFRGASKLMNIICLAETPPSIQSTTFINVPETCLIKVPANSVEVYKTATNWSDRADYIVAYEEV